MRSHPDSLRWKIVLPALAAVSLLVVGTMAAIADQDAGKSDSSRRATPQVADVKVKVAGMQISIDPKTGRMRPPTPEESRAIGEALRQQFGTPSQPLQVIQAENGALAVELPEEFMETAVFRIHEDGTQSIDCMSANEAANLMSEESSVIRLPESGRQDAVRARQTKISPKAEKE